MPPPTLFLISHVISSELEKDNMEFVLIFSILSLCPFIKGSPDLSQCPDNNLDINGGNFTLSNMYNERSVLQYICPYGYYPSVKKRECFHGSWDPAPTKRRPVCKKVTCPDPRGMPNGDVDPSKPLYYVNDVTTYSCHTDYKFRGSSTRVCQVNGKWNGSTPICSRDLDHCPDPGSPPGTIRKGQTFDIDDKVTYSCERNLKLIGSKKRVCQDNGQWSGKEPECYAHFTYDTPEEVAEMFSSSLKTTLTINEDGGQAEKRIRLDQGGNLDIYIALDASDSIDEKDFENAKKVITDLIEKISFYQVSPNYEILIFTTKVTPIVTMANFKTKAKTMETVITDLENFKYESKGQQSGTNIASAYRHILESISFEKIRDPKRFLDTNHVVIMFTDGIYNMGGAPKVWVDQIEQAVLDGKVERKDFLDLYVFGLGADVVQQDLDEWVTKRDDNDNHLFLLKNIAEIQQTFDQMIDETTSVGLCGLYRSYTDQRPSYPWLIKIVVTHDSATTGNCFGSLVTPRFILTAAHCFRFGDTPEKISVEAVGTKGSMKVKQYLPHESFNITQKQKEGILEYYENDVALIELEQSVKLTPDLRPICIPCTEETSGALKLSGNDVTCKKHKEMLMKSNLVKAGFMSEIKKVVKKKNAQIRLEQMKEACVEDTKEALNISMNVAKGLISDSFLCTGGSANNKIDDTSCKGDSGGATFVEQKYRLIQVGIVSWGLNDECKSKKKGPTRDFHTNLFQPEVQKFLKRYLGNEKIDTPLHFLD